ncbi:MAG: EAL domain-containing protein [Acidimicrobiia bacterium]|nr:EAL domain-containing protein [Acidimicrobiia bacterium]
MRRPRLTPLVLSILLVLATGATGLVLTARASSKSEALHRQDRETLQTTLGGLSNQYLLFAFKDELDFASSGPWSLTAGNRADAARLQAAVSRSAILTYGAALVGLDHQPLNVYATDSAGLPPPTDLGYLPLINGLLQNQPGLSSVMHVGAIPVVGLGVPVMEGGVPKAVLIGFFRADRTPLQSYAERLRYGRTGRGYIVDSTGTVVAASDAAAVGTTLLNNPGLTAASSGRHGFAEFGSGSHRQVVSYAPVGVGGWSVPTLQSAGEFFGPIRSGQLRVELALLALLALAAAVIAVLTYKREAARRQFQEELARQAYHDSLTGLPNRSAFSERLQSALASARRHGEGLAVLFLDLDRFKVVNDSLGHERGDELLAAVATRLQACLRAEDTVARMGGDEFTVLVERLDGAVDAVSTAERILAEMARPFDVNGHQTNVGVSIGIALSEGADSEQDLLRDADLAMYQAKEHGRSTWAVFENDLAERARERLDLETELRHAIDGGELVLYYQPEMDLEHSSIVGMEALVRWNHPRLGLLAPDRFIPLAEETGLIVPLGRWVLREACAQAVRWQRRHGADAIPRMSVNVSGRQFDRGALFVAEVAETLEETGLPAGSLMLEITETVIMGDVHAAVETVTGIQALGVGLAIDDFGVGYSSLSHLRELPIDNLKLDRSFVAGLKTHKADAAIARSVMVLARSLHLTVTAEGIETQEQLGQLQSLGCVRGQGFYFQRPVSARQIGRLLGQHALT